MGEFDLMTPPPYPPFTLDPLIDISKFTHHDHVEVIMYIHCIIIQLFRGFFFFVFRVKRHMPLVIIFDTDVHMLKNYVIIIDLF